MKAKIYSILFISLFSIVACKKDPPPTIKIEDVSTRFKAIITDSIGNKLKGAFIVLYEGTENLTNLRIAHDSKATDEQGIAIFSNLDASKTYYFVSYKGYNNDYSYTVFYPNLNIESVTAPVLKEGDMVEKTQIIKLVKDK